MNNYIKKYIDQGFSIFPCIKSANPDINKAPLTPHGFKDASNDQEIIKKQFYKDDLLIGFPTGQKNSIVVIDFDINKKIPGTDNIDTRTVEELIEEVKENYGELPDTLMVKTPSGGQHNYYSIPDNVELRSGNRFIDKSLSIDIKADGGYVIAPDGIDYIIYDDVDDLGIENLKSRCASLPQWIIDIRKQQSENNNSENLPANILPESEIKEIRSALAYLSSENRDDWIKVGLALKSTGSVSAYGLWNEWSKTSDKYNPNDMEKRWAGLKPNDITIASLFHIAQQHGWVTTYEKNDPSAKPQANKKLGIPAWITANFGLEYSKEMLAELEKAPPPKQGGRCHFLKMNYPEFGNVTIAARTGRGKSTALANIERELMQQEKSIVKLSIEEPFNLAFSRLAQSFGYEIAHKEGITITNSPQISWLGRFNAFHTDDKWMKKGAEIVKKYINDGQLRIIDNNIADGPRKLLSFYETLKQNQGRHIITLDYMQILEIGANRSFEIWGDVASKIVETMTQGKTLLIAAAQLNRLGTETSVAGKNYDPIVEQIRESASIEQMASLVIGGGEQEGFKFFKLMKDRFSQIGTGKYLMNNTPDNWMGKQYMLPNTGDWGYQKTQHENPLKNQKSKNKKPLEGQPWIKK